MLFWASVATSCGPQERPDRQSSTLATPEQQAVQTADHASSAADLVTAYWTSTHIELEASRVAARNGVDKNVQQFAHTLVTESTQNRRNIESVARGLSIMATAPDATSDAVIGQLRQTDPTRFDATYLDTIVTTLEDTIELLEQYSQSGADAELRDWAQEQLPALRVRLEEADTLRQSVSVASR